MSDPNKEAQSDSLQTFRNSVLQQINLVEGVECKCFTDLAIDPELKSKLVEAFGDEYLEVNGVALFAGGFESRQDIVDNWEERLNLIQSATLGFLDAFPTKKVICLGQYPDAVEFLKGEDITDKVSYKLIAFVRNPRLLTNFIKIGYKDMIEFEGFARFAESSFKRGKVKILKNDLTNLAQEILAVLKSNNLMYFEG